MIIKDKINSTFLVLALVIAFSFWNFKSTEARVEEGEMPGDVKEEILWLARVLYSETKRENEQVMVAWVVRNRVEASFRGSTYKEVALAKGQFSGLHPADAQYRHNISRNFESEGESWQSALEIAEGIYNAPDFLRPFSKDVRHFYSPRSLSIPPDWSAGLKPTLVIRDLRADNVRFSFYESVK